MAEGTAATHRAGQSFLERRPEQIPARPVKSIYERGARFSLGVGMVSSKSIAQKILQMARCVDILLVSLDEAVWLRGTGDLSWRSQD
jgi:sugar/nucleoside kinase (ribokinase family)